jgi:2'-hydroxyisoflavone reductase
MKLLVLGGTKFLGRHVVAEALALGHDVTMFNRGHTNPSLFPEAERLRGDRDDDLGALVGREWDAVIDPSGYVPRIVRQSAELLRDAVGRYVFVSTVNVYADYCRSFSEANPLAELADPTSEDVGVDYGPLKAACEQVLDSIYGDRVSHIRAGLIVGPHDWTWRFTYWPMRIREGGDVLVPDVPERRVQFIDVRDVSKWALRLAEADISGPFNTTGPAESLTMGEFVGRLAGALGASCRFHWLDSQTLVDEGVTPWTELPLWLPGEEWDGLLEADVSRALANGLTHRPLEQTSRDVLAWTQTSEAALPMLSRAREAELLHRYADVAAA